MRDFWIACGHHLLDRNASGGLVVTDEFLKAYFVRPELTPPQDACAAEHALHGQLSKDPRLHVEAGQVTAIADADARENWHFVLTFRDLLLRHPTLEAAYLGLIRSGTVHLPPLFVNQLVHVIMRNALHGCEDPFVLRAAELFFRPQRLIPHDHHLLLGDAETFGDSKATPVLSLMSLLDPHVDAQVDILCAENAETYWQRSDQFDFALDLTGGSAGSIALAEAIRHWILHLLGIDVTIEPLTALRNAKFSWYVGLDVEATKLGDRLWKGDELDERTQAHVLALFQLTFADARLVIETVGREPVYLILAMTSGQLVRMKPQNLVTGLPIKHLEATS